MYYKQIERKPSKPTFQGLYSKQQPMSAKNRSGVFPNHLASSTGPYAEADSMAPTLQLKKRCWEFM